MQVTIRRGNPLQSSREACPRISYRGPEAAPLLSGSSDHGGHLFPHQSSHSQARSVWTTCKVAIELGEYNVIFRPATAIKSQVLADFVAKFSPSMLPALEQEVKLRDNEKEKGEWTLHVDGSSNVGVW